MNVGESLGVWFQLRGYAESKSPCCFNQGFIQRMQQIMVRWNIAIVKTVFDLLNQPSAILLNRTDACSLKNLNGKATKEVERQCTGCNDLWIQ